MRTTLIAGTTLFAAVAVSSALAQPSCGDPPRVDDLQLKGELDGKARFLSSFLGDSSLSGKVEASRIDVLSQYPNADQVRSNAYLQYMFCSFVLSDQRPSWAEKSNALMVFASTMSHPVDKRQVAITAVDKAVADLNRIVVDKGNYLFPDIGRYTAHPSAAAWNDVIADAKRQLRIVENAVDSVEVYDATLVSNEGGTLSRLHKDLRQRGSQLRSLLDTPSDPLPNTALVERWSQDYGNLIFELQQELLQLRNRVRT